LTAGPRAGLSTQKVAARGQHNHWFIRAGYFVARCTKGIVHARRTGRGRELYGTNFRHAVEFSRSGRTPSRSFRTDRGQPEILYLVGSARSNTGSRPDSRLVGALEEDLRASCLGEHPPGPARWSRLSASRLLRLRPADKENISRSAPRDANSPADPLHPPSLLACSPPGTRRSRSSRRGRVL
jgi:hypothetical protein